MAKFDGVSGTGEVKVYRPQLQNEGQTPVQQSAPPVVDGGDAGKPVDEVSATAAAPTADETAAAEERKNNKLLQAKKTKALSDASNYSRQMAQIIKQGKTDFTVTEKIYDLYSKGFEALSGLDVRTFSDEEQKVITGLDDQLVLYEQMSGKTDIKSIMNEFGANFKGKKAFPFVAKTQLSEYVVTARDEILRTLNPESLTSVQADILKRVTEAVKNDTPPDVSGLNKEIADVVTDIYNSKRDLGIPTEKKLIYMIKSYTDDFGVQSAKGKDKQIMELFDLAVQEYLMKGGRVGDTDDGQLNTRSETFAELDAMTEAEGTENLYNTDFNPSEGRVKAYWNAKKGIISEYARKAAIDVAGFDPATGKYVDNNGKNQESKNGTITRHRH